MAEVEDEVWQALDDYEEVCNKAYCEEETEESLEVQETSGSSSEEQDFPEPLQSLAVSASSQEAQVGTQENQTILEGTTPDIMGTQYTSPVTSNFVSSTSPLQILPKLPSRKHLAKQLKLASSQSMHVKVGKELTLKRLMS
ncbi:hypothetical protein CTheo_9081 [Ceratobasidium theobromae]|uniref:Uncharacterized protein n=1 Tax=Ceratobasidium theobromae TaxID=1582974 RepID=A0A5N5Q6F8_9AGAM|nr:hypothetical protein CTheo_9081 [Ceratobasidium theobromae]